MPCTEHSLRPGCDPFCHPHLRTALRCRDVRRQNPGGFKALRSAPSTCGMLDFAPQPQASKKLSKLGVSYLLLMSICTQQTAASGFPYVSISRRPKNGLAPPELPPNISPDPWYLGHLTTALPHPCHGAWLNHQRMAGIHE